VSRPRPFSEPRAALFLDRDGTLIDEFGYLADPDGVRLFPGVGECLGRLAGHSIPQILITNQSGVARGLFSEATLAQVHARLQELLHETGPGLTDIYYCPHHPELGEAPYRVECTCRKPAPGMYLKAAREWNLDLARSVAVGDTERDLEAAHRAGVGTRILVLTGKGQKTFDGWAAEGKQHCATHVFADLPSSEKLILKALQAGAPGV